MSNRVSRAEQTGQNRERVLQAARRVFVARGFHTATLDQIAEEAGFSKGVIYSQFESKAEVFLTLLERRIEQRAAQQETLAERLDGIEDFETLYAEISRVSRADPAWRLLVIEFRVFAARDRKLNQRYAELHARTLAGVTAMLGLLYERSGVVPPAPLEVLAASLAAYENGCALEEAVGVEPRREHQARLIGRMLGAPTARTQRRRG